MQIIIGHEQAQELRKKYTVLFLETITKDGVTVDAYCVVPAEKINLGEMANLEQNQQLHQEFANAAAVGNYERCQELYEHLHGRFGGELDSYYDEILARTKY